MLCRQHLDLGGEGLGPACGRRLLCGEGFARAVGQRPEILVGHRAVGDLLQPGGQDGDVTTGLVVGGVSVTRLGIDRPLRFDVVGRDRLDALGDRGMIRQQRVEAAGEGLRLVCGRRISAGACGHVNHAPPVRGSVVQLYRATEKVKSSSLKLHGPGKHRH